MFLVCDSGSTKADWLLSDGKNVSGPYHTIGFNPYFHNADFVFDTLSEDGSLQQFAKSVTEIYFFGAGCSGTERKEEIAKGLRRYFTNAKVEVDHDLLACAYASCGDEPGISCIIGTGSNSCWFDGVQVHEQNYGLGYILGDEGSGSYFGKKLLTQFLYGLMPSEIHNDFLDSYGLDRNMIIDHVYKQANPNVWLASFATFLSKHREHPYMQQLIRKGLGEFFELYVCAYPDYQNKKIHFVGSIAYYFERELRALANDLNCHVGNIIKQPVQGLMDYYLKKK